MSRKWHKGPPPHVGWWNASVMCDAKCWRWWNGKWWSKQAYPEFYGHEVARAARNRAWPSEFEIEWTDRYPKNARVPRIDPRKVK